MSGLIELRAEHERRLNKLLKKDMIREIKKRLKRGSKELRPESSRDALSVAQSMLKEVARPSGPVSEDILHQYRRVVKRARYTAEFAPKSAKAVLLVSQLKRLQDALGSWHDWLTLTQSAATRLGDVNQSSLVAALHNVTGGKFRHAVSALSASPALHAAAKPVAAASSEQTRRMSTKGPTLVGQAESAA
jgi:CHAD domain-containing protein